MHPSQLHTRTPKRCLSNSICNIQVKEWISFDNSIKIRVTLYCNSITVYGRIINLQSTSNSIPFFPTLTFEPTNGVNNFFFVFLFIRELIFHSSIYFQILNNEYYWKYSEFIYRLAKLAQNSDNNLFLSNHPAVNRANDVSTNVVGNEMQIEPNRNELNRTHAHTHTQQNIYSNYLCILRSIRRYITHH